MKQFILLTDDEIKSLSEHRPIPLRITENHLIIICQEEEYRKNKEGIEQICELMERNNEE